MVEPHQVSYHPCSNFPTRVTFYRSFPDPLAVGGVMPEGNLGSSQFETYSDWITPPTKKDYVVPEEIPSLPMPREPTPLGAPAAGGAAKGKKK
jgi:hypothetical protein